MNLKIHLHPLGEDSTSLIASLIPEEKREIVSNRWSVMLDDPVLKEILHSGDSTKGFWLSCEAILTKSELKEMTHYEVVCRKYISESKQDYEANFALVKKTPLVKKGGESPILLAKGFSLSHISMKPNMVGAIGDWTGEYVIGTGVASIFNKHEFPELSLIPITNQHANKPHENYFQIFSASILDSVVNDSSIERIKSDDPEENGKLRHLGCLTYHRKFLKEKADFLRSAEPWAGWWGWPSWVVSNKVVSKFKENKFRGWVFRPVLIYESELYSTYQSNWDYLNNLLSKYSRTTFDGGRW